jgi:cytochrome b involved in lipid metabolism
VTKFLEDHPGGDDVLLSATGVIKVAVFLAYI